MNRLIVIGLSVLIALTACVAKQPFMSQSSLTPVDERISDEAIAADKQVFRAVENRIIDLNRSGIPLADYYLAKAQAWLEFAEEEYLDNDRSGIIEFALENALHLVQQLEDRAPEISTDTSSIPGRRVLRPDLWWQVDELKDRGARCAGEKTAQLEVQLVRIDHAERELGWQHARPYIQAAERLARQASEYVRTHCRVPLGRAIVPAVSSALRHSKDAAESGVSAILTPSQPLTEVVTDIPLGSDIPMVLERAINDPALPEPASSEEIARAHEAGIEDGH